MLSIRSLFDNKKKAGKAIQYVEVEQTESTNDHLSKLAAEMQNNEIAALPDILVLSAGYQSAGRGQGCNSWESERDKNLLFSILCHPGYVPIAKQFILSEAVSLAITDVLAEIIDDVTIKWPNDIYWKDRKLGGILIENTLSGGHIKNCIVGIGLNINQVHFKSDAPNPVSLIQIIGSYTDRMPLLKKIAERFKFYLNAIENGSYESIIVAYMSRLFRLEGFHSFKDKNGLFEAAIVTVEDDGHLILRDRSDIIRSFVFKEVCFII